jgi:hypothetical protein
MCFSPDGLHSRAMPVRTAFSVARLQPLSGEASNRHEASRASRVCLIDCRLATGLSGGTRQAAGM